MDKIDNIETCTTAAQTPPTFRKTIGKTTYRGGGSFQHHQHGNHERQNYTPDSK